MRSRRFIYSQIRTIDQLRAERNSLDWHIKGLEDRVKNNVPGTLSKGKWISLILPVAITAFTLVRQVNRCVRKIRDK
ncbi:MAG: hypothetical protein GX281_04910 [Bacteroidales bacterium]|jgi:hypothetical protein|nr:hypothetical protein [Bacteroidales bacterium]NLK80039.1 hypothetical protein [Bacteroidales bacterium]HKM31009.1 hypothetical protein [Bacteroidales bacterium]HPX79871.1 hypothetical protein [Bacteroidales bacterium]HQB23309.1 hypothetical protein [Bacteroidales bacterium]